MNPIFDQSRQAAQETQWSAQRFWQTEGMRERNAAEALDRMEASAPAEAAAQLRLARVAVDKSPNKLELYREAFDNLQSAMLGAICPLAGYALVLLKASDQPLSHKTELAAELLKTARPDLSPVAARRAGFMEALGAHPEAILKALQQPTPASHDKKLTAFAEGVPDPDWAGAAAYLRSQAPAGSEASFQQLVQLDALQLSDYTRFKLTEQVLSRLEDRQPPTLADVVQSTVFWEPQHADAPKLADWWLKQDQGYLKPVYEALGSDIHAAVPLVKGHTALHHVSLYSLGGCLSEAVAAEPKLARPALEVIRKRLSSATTEDAAHARARLAVLEKLSPEGVAVGLKCVTAPPHFGIREQLAATRTPAERTAVVRGLLAGNPHPGAAFARSLPGLGVTEENQMAVYQQAAADLHGTGGAHDLAGRAFTAAERSDNLADRLNVARAGLAALEPLTPPEQHPALLMLQNLARLDERQPHHNALWLNAALAMDGLRLAYQGLPDTPGGVAELGFKVLDAPWMVPAWFGPAARVVAEAYQQAGGELPSDWSLEGKSPAQIRGMVASLGLGTEAAAVRTLAREQPFSLLEGPAPVVRSRHKVQVHWDEVATGARTGVYNPDQGGMEFFQVAKGTVAGVYNPQTGKVEWKAIEGESLAGRYDPARGQAVFARPTDGFRVHADFHPVTRESSFDEGYLNSADVRNPLSGQTASAVTEKNESVAAVWDPAEGKARSRSSTTANVFVVSSDPAAPTVWSRLSARVT